MSMRKSRRGSANAAKDIGLTAVDRAIVLWLNGHGKSALAKDIADHLEESGHGQTARENIDRLIAMRLVERHGRNRYRLAMHRLQTGQLSRTDNGFAFVKANGRAEDIFIPAGKLANAFHGDTVLLVVDKRGQGEIIGGIGQQEIKLAGICRLAKKRAVFLPEDGHYPAILPLTANSDIGGSIPSAANGQMVIARLARPPSGQVTAVFEEILGDPDSAFVQARLVILAHALPAQFPAAALAELAAMREPGEPGDRISGQPDDAAARLDLRQIFHLTIDGEDAKDFDDAIAVQMRGEGFRLYVSIADVGHYVRAGGALDGEAYKRGTSIYFPGIVIPMLPERLANDLCSLKPGEPRFCLSAILDFSADGALVDKSFHRSLIISRRRCSYTEAAAVLASQDKISPDAALASSRRQQARQGGTRQTWRQSIVLAARLAAALRKRREAQGAINLSVTEPLFIIDTAGYVKSSSGRQASLAQQLIEECMLAANMAVAAELTAKGQTFLYRIHEMPDAEKTENFYRLACSFGLNPSPPAHSPAWFQTVLHQAAGTPREHVIAHLILRTLRQARYAPGNSGHFALAADCYCHFTSPIRRYPDLLTHRALARLFDNKKEEENMELLSEAGDWLSSRERLAIAASREMNDRLWVVVMADRIGENFTAIISGLSPTMIFVQLLDPPASGAVALRHLSERYFYDREKQCLTGEVSREIFVIGDMLTVRLIEVDRRRRHLNFMITASGGKKKPRQGGTLP